MDIPSPNGHPAIAQADPCPRCGAPPGPRRRAFLVCDACGHHLPVPAASRLTMLLDAGSFAEIGADLVSYDPLLFQDTITYPDQLPQAPRKTRFSEASVP